MNNFIVSGSSGFVGQNLKKYILTHLPDSNFIPLSRDAIHQQKINFNFQNACVVHLAGKAHDVKNVSNSADYFIANTKLTEQVFDAFLTSPATVFIMMSSVKAGADKVEGILTEEFQNTPATAYGKSKLAAEAYIQSKEIPAGKRVYILRPCMIHGPGNKGNLNLLYQIVSKRFPWPLGAFENKRSFCSIENLCFVIKELVQQTGIPSGIYQVADDQAISTNELIQLIATVQKKSPIIFKVPKSLIQAIAKLGDHLKLPLNSDRLQKLTENYVVSNKKIVTALGKPLPLETSQGLVNTIHSFQ